MTSFNAVYENAIDSQGMHSSDNFGRTLPLENVKVYQIKNIIYIYT